LFPLLAAFHLEHLLQSIRVRNIAEWKHSDCSTWNTPKLFDDQRSHGER